ncbi:hypothetical protein J6590_098351 [Homalodisca vitripennis]|nr:hypothetical protein J6590_098351 [Homalodisca vitripennis]
MHRTKRTLSGPRATRHWQKRQHTRSSSSRTKFDSAQYARYKAKSERPTCNQILANTHMLYSNRDAETILKHTSSSSCRSKFDIAQDARHKAKFEWPSCNKTLAHKDVTLAS